jgi:hypothetical protein
VRKKKLIGLVIAAAAAVLSGERECDGEGEDEPRECAEFVEKRRDILAGDQPLLDLRGGDQDPPNDRNESDDEERFKN